MTTNQKIIQYKASPTGAKFHQDNSFVRAVLGCVGSGKSVMMIMELFIRAQQQKPAADGVRYTRWLIVRNTYSELRDTTFNTFKQWCPMNVEGIEERKQEFKVTIDVPLPDGTRMHAEFLFRALDRPDDVGKLLSLEITGAFLNESRELPKAIFDAIQTRVGRYPSKREGGATWFGIIMDTNPPDSDSWFYKLFEENLPTNHKLFKQPSGLAPDAENKENLPPNYYENMMQGKDQEWINVYVHGIYGFISDGKPIWHEYVDSTHANSDFIYHPSPKHPIYIGIDFGLTPAATFAQRESSGRVVVFDELVTEDMGAKRFGALLKQHINEHYPEHEFEFDITADPAGEQRAQTDETTPFQILASEGLIATPAHTNDFTIRREAVAQLMTTLDFTGRPALLLTAGAPMLRKAMAGGYKYKRLSVAGSERFQDKPDKNKYSHVAESFQYLALGMGLGSNIIKSKAWDSKIDYSHIDSQIV